jgi:membrane fusion protein (multidrug efflux system)
LIYLLFKQFIKLLRIQLKFSVYFETSVLKPRLFRLIYLLKGMEKSMKQRFLFTIIGLFFATFLFISCGGEGSAQNNDSEAKNDSTASDSLKKAEKDKKEKDSELIPVEVTSIGTGVISSFILVSSNLETEIQADVYARAQGIVEKILIEEGQYIAKDAVMLKLEAREYEIAEKKAHVEYEKQLSLFKRQQVMLEEELLSQEEFDQVKYTMQSAQYTLEDAKLRLDYMSITSPISGWVGERLTKIGARVQPSDKLFSVVNKTEVIAVVYIPEKNINELKMNQQAIVTSENLLGENFDAQIKRISPVVDPSSGTFKVTVGVNNKDQKLKPGMFVNVHLIIDTHNDALLVPKTAIVYENEYMNVFVVRDSVATKIRLEPGFQDSEKIEALNETIKPDDKVIVVGQAGMKDKTKVRIVSERENTFLAKSEDDQ